MTFVDDLIPDVGKVEIMRHHGILPCHILLRNLRIMIPVTFHYDVIVQRMIDHDYAEILQMTVLCLICRKETDIQIRSPHIHPVRLCGIEGMESLGYVFRLVRILETVTQDYHVMGESAAIGIIQIALRLKCVLAARHQYQCHQRQFQFTSHSF